MTVVLSSAQKRALNPRKSCWVEASAGSGKTKVLTDRILRLLLARVPFDHILCLTFTNAGAIEMANRLQNRLYQWTMIDESTLRHELTSLGLDIVAAADIALARSLFGTLLDKPFGIRIQTLHAFCQFLLRTFPLEVGLMPHFDILDELQSVQLKREAFSEAINACSLEALSQLSLHGSLTTIERLSHEMLAEKEAWLGGNNDESFESRKREVLSHFLSINDHTTPESLTTDFLEKMPDFHTFESTFRMGTDADQKLYQQIKMFMEASLNEKETLLPTYSRLFLTLKNEPRKKYLSTQLKSATALHQLFEKEAQRLLSFRTTHNHLIIFHASMALMEVGRHYIHSYERLKKERGVVDYDDLITRALRLLENAHNKPWILFKLEYEIHHILIDEAQDTSREQWNLIAALVSEFFPSDSSQNEGKTLFVVGDIKQSIYSFQGADPKSFQAVRHLFSALPDWDFIDLTTSYRSTPPVLTFVDRVFENIRALSTPYQTHESFRQKARGLVEIWPLVREREDAPNDPSSLDPHNWSLPSEQKRPDVARLTLAHQLAAVIEGWLTNRVQLVGRDRPIEPRDIMILVRRREAFVDELVRALKKRHVPVTGLDRLHLLDQIAVQDLLVLADVILFPPDDLALATLLKSPLFVDRLSEEDLFALAHNRGEQSLWERLNVMPQGIPYRQRLDQYKELAHLNPSPYDFFTRVLAQDNGWSHFITRLGSEAQDVLEEFLTLCLKYQKNNAPNLQDFVVWIREQSVEIKRTFDPSTENNVRILTVHGAKGLESPIVILPDTTQVPREYSPLYWLPSTTPASGATLWVPDQSYQTPLIKNAKASSDTQEEYYRLLYVALTRAADQLYICGWEHKGQTTYPSWYDVCKQALQEIDAHEKTHDCMYIGERMVDKNVSHKAYPSIETLPLPLWIREPLGPQTTGDRKKTLTPQQQRGIFIHKILEHLGRNPDKRHIDTIIDTYLNLIPERKDLKKSVMAVLHHKDFDRYFTQHTLTEIPISGTLNGQHYSCVIDVLTIHEAQRLIYILDYKTGRPHPSSLYKGQLRLYKKLVQNVYPDYHIETALLWTESGEIERIDSVS